ncbi:hypothetical protein Acr_24g0010630 [Actinidia rufa]|uniref:Uncharacterized protein n=1 Tax=Actinidia rufa TaxID=165716 RepID=A0A7J0GVQ1_9ERIC|nr:hypothetical protein Acr_24g0010630 [Actinidia rufa]
MALMAVVLSIHIDRVDVLVRECGSSDSCHLVNDAYSSSLSCVVSSSSYGVSGGDMDIDLVSSFCGHEKKVLKSDGWVYLIKEVGQKLQTWNGYFYIKDLDNVHTCGAAMLTTDNARDSSRLIGMLIRNEVRVASSKR